MDGYTGAPCQVLKAEPMTRIKTTKHLETVVREYNKRLMEVHFHNEEELSAATRIVVGY